MNALHNLSASGWVLFAITTIHALGFLARIPARNWKGVDYHVVSLGILLIWMLWLVTP